MDTSRRCYGVTTASNAVNLIVQTAFLAEKSIHLILFLIGSINNNAEALSKLIEEDKRFRFSDLKNVTTTDAECKDDSEIEDASSDDDDNEGAVGGDDDSDNDSEDSSGEDDSDNEQGDSDSDSDENDEDDDSDEDSDEDSDDDEDDDEDDEDEDEDNQPPVKKKK